MAFPVNTTQRMTQGETLESITWENIANLSGASAHLVVRSSRSLTSPLVLELYSATGDLLIDSDAETVTCSVNALSAADSEVLTSASNWHQLWITYAGNTGRRCVAEGPWIIAQGIASPPDAPPAFSPASLPDQLFGWFETDLDENTTISSYNGVPVISQEVDANGSGSKIYRVDGIQSGYAVWLGQSSAQRPGKLFSGTTAYNIAAGAGQSLAAGDWTVAIRVTADANSGGPVIAFNVGTDNSRINVHTGVGGITIVDGSNTSVGHPGTIAADTDAAVVLSRSGTTVTILYGGIEVSGTLSGALDILTPWLGYDGTNAYHGTIDMITIWQRQLSSDERSEVAEWAAAPENDLPSLGKALLFGSGNSIMYGADASMSMTARVSSLINASHLTINTAISAQDTEHFLDNYTSLIGQFITDLAASGSQTYFVFEEGINDLYFHQDASGAYDNLVTIATQSQALGAEVVLVSLTPRDGEGANAVYAGYDADRLAVNVNLRNLASPPYTLADVGADPSVGDAADAHDGTYYAVDGSAPDRAWVHPTNAGQVVYAGIIKTALNTLGLA